LRVGSLGAGVKGTRRPFDIAQGKRGETETERQFLAGVLGVVILGAALFSSLSLIIACVVKTRERFMGIGQVLTMPLFFASNAIYPISFMPGWLQVMAHVNPLTYEVDALRALMVVGGTSVFGLGADAGILLTATTILVIIGGWMYPNVAI
jgi:ABC-2 type transport system permease protein